MSNHTPGPWRVDDYFPSKIWGDCIIDEDGEVIRLGTPIAEIDNYKRMWGRKIKEEEHWANAYLIAAAPDLLEACEFMERRSRQPDETINVHYERIAERFYLRHGFLAPGKDDPNPGNGEYKQQKWEEFCREPIEAMRAAIKKARGE